MDGGGKGKWRALWGTGGVIGYTQLFLSSMLSVSSLSYLYHDNDVSNVKRDLHLMVKQLLFYEHKTEIYIKRVYANEGLL